MEKKLAREQSIELFEEIQRKNPHLSWNRDR